MEEELDEVQVHVLESGGAHVEDDDERISLGLEVVLLQPVDEDLSQLQIAVLLPLVPDVEPEQRDAVLVPPVDIHHLPLEEGCESPGCQGRDAELGAPLEGLGEDRERDVLVEVAAAEELKQPVVVGPKSANVAGCVLGALDGRPLGLEETTTQLRHFRCFRLRRAQRLC